MKYLNRVPCLRLVVPYILGILLSTIINWSHPYILWSSIFLFIFSIYAHYKLSKFKNRWIYGLALSLSISLFGFHHTWKYNELNHSSHFKNHISSDENLLICQVSEMPVWKNKRISFKAEIEQLGINKDSLKKVSGNLLVYIDRDTLSEKLTYGDVIILQGKNLEITPPKNPEAFNYKSYLHYQNVHYQLFIQKEKWLKTDINQGQLLYSTAFEQRKKFLKILKKYLPDEKSFSVGSALILGYKDEMNDEIKDAYAETGAMHVLAVSGLHVGIVYLIISFLLSKIFPFKNNKIKILSAIISFLGIWAFALLTGASPSVLRASTMLSVIIFGNIFARNNVFYNSLALSALVLLLHNPYILFNIGFQLSYLAVAGIVYFQPKFYSYLFFENKILDFCWNLTTVSFAAQLSTLPLTLYYFHQFPSYFWLSGLIVVPAASLILSAGILLFFFESIYLGAGFIFGYFLFYLISIVNFFIFGLQLLPISIIKGIWINGFLAILLYIFIAFLIKSINTRKGRNITIGLGFLAFVLMAMSFQKSQLINNKQIIVYDLYKKSMFDFINSTTAYSLTSNEIEQKNIDFSAENYRYSQYVNKVEVFHIDYFLNFQNNFLLLKKDFVQFYDKRLFLLDKMPTTTSSNVKIDYILIHNNPRLSIEKLVQFFQFKEIIFDGSNSKWKVEKWKKECDALGIKYHYTSESGAWVLNLNQ